MKRLDFIGLQIPIGGNGMRVIKPFDTPKEAQESYKHYLEQISGEQGKSL